MSELDQLLREIAAQLRIRARRQCPMTGPMAESAGQQLAGGPIRVELQLRRPEWLAARWLRTERGPRP